MTAVGDAYESSARLWASGPERMYGALARELLASSGLPLAGLSVLDVGAGTGVAGRAALSAGARPVVCADLALRMLRRCEARTNPVVADAMALPFLDRSFDLVVAAFCLGHLPDLGAGLRETRRVGPWLAASSFAPGWTHPAKAAIDEVLARFGYEPPAWHARFKRELEPRGSDPAELERLARAAGYASARLSTIRVATGLSTAAEIASWRLGMAHVAPFVSSLEPRRRLALTNAAESAVAGTEPVVVTMLMLVASADDSERARSG
ncbi:MAG TPA: methyltransferase domain-containing protein [Streptosporangiaceae bacterium]|nr:methyltransferase domain-containing protein [Streptosporangiaceae bacterium]